MFFEKTILHDLIILAERGGNTQPNPRVACFIFSPEGQKLSEGFHRGAGTDHAEVDALKNLRPEDAPRAHTMLVTLEPCNHHGRTPPCTEAILKYGIKRLVFLSNDPHPDAKGGGDFLRSKGLDVHYLADDRAYELNASWFHWIKTGRALIRMKIAASLDGRISDSRGESTWVTSPWARAVGRKLRGLSGAVLVGAGTIKADAPKLTSRTPGLPDPLPILWDPRGRLEDAPSVERKGAIIGGAERQNLIPEGWERWPTRLTATEISEMLGSRGIHELLIEGGPGAWAFFEPAADRLEYFMSPKIIGGSSWWIGQSNLVSEEPHWEPWDRVDLGKDIWLRYKRCLRD